jgi:betaine-aldehyde dehydrogenase
MTILVDPVTGARGEEVPDAGPVEVDQAVARARDALDGPWGEATPRQRQDLLLRWAAGIEAHVEELTELEVEDTGKPWGVVADGELPFALDNIRFFAGAARSVTGSGAGQFAPGYTSLLQRRGVGVVGAIAPWNFPLVMAVWKLAAPMAAGCGVVIKPATQTPRSTLRLVELLAEAGAPDGLVAAVTGDAVTGQALVAHPGVAMITLTGSSDTGRRVMAAAVPTLKRLHLELGGKAPAVVFADADLEAAAAGIALGATYNSGQDCTAATRVHVEATVHDSLVEALRDQLAGIRLGAPRDADTDIGPLISVAHRGRVHGFVERARAGGAQVVCGGAVPAGPGAFYPPTLVTTDDPTAEIVRAEVFGPVIVVLAFGSEAQAVRAANDTPYGLAASVWTTDVARALRVGGRIQAGVVWVNDHLPIASEMPHGGVKQSGFGKDMSHEAVLEFSVSQHLMLRHAAPASREAFRPA